MDFSVFYAWQSDRPQNTHRYLIRAAAKEAVKRIGRDVDVEDSPRLDHDTKNVPGTPEIAGTIFRKIQESGAFVADLTFIGATDLHDGVKKLLPNSNVLLELGYAARSIGWDRIICVMNTAYGPVEEQIFDIKQRRWPICYRLEGENPEDIQKAKEYLSGQLQNAIRMVMNSAHEAVEEAIGRLSSEALRFIERHKRYVYFWTADEDVGRLGARWLADAEACLFGTEADPGVLRACPGGQQVRLHLDLHRQAGRKEDGIQLPADSARRCSRTSATRLFSSTHA
jgi:hypothetical protein